MDCSNGTGERYCASLCPSFLGIVFVDVTL